MYRKGLFLTVLTVIALFTSVIGLTNDYIPPRVGECLEYQVIVNSMMHGADQTIRVVESGVYRERPTIKVQCVMDSVGLAKSITKYKETEEVILDLEGLYPWVIRHEISDKDGTKTEEVTFDYPNGAAVRIFSENGGSKERTVIQLPGYVQDLLSLQFFLRKNISLGVNQVYLYSDGEIKKIGYQITEISEPLNLACGQFQRYYRIYNPAKNITILLAGTPEHYPLVIQTNSKIGKIEAKLVEIR